MHPKISYSLLYIDECMKDMAWPRGSSMLACRHRFPNNVVNISAYHVPPAQPSAQLNTQSLMQQIWSRQGTAEHGREVGLISVACTRGDRKVEEIIKSCFERLSQSCRCRSTLVISHHLCSTVPISI